MNILDVLNVIGYNYRMGREQAVNRVHTILVELGELLPELSNSGTHDVSLESAGTEVLFLATEEVAPLFPYIVQEADYDNEEWRNIKEKLDGSGIAATEGRRKLGGNSGAHVDRELDITITDQFKDPQKRTPRRLGR